MSNLMNSLFGNPRTTLAGIVGAIGAYLITQPGAWGVVGQILMGLGALFLGVNSKDAAVGSSGLKPNP
jgi:Na+/phosphate symporter